MTLSEFAAVLEDRIPTPAEFLAFVEGQKWRVAQNEKGPVLKVPDRTDAVAVGLARMLSREPYRTNVLAVIFPPPKGRIVPPAGKRLYYSSRDGSPCGPGDKVYMWCWEGGPQWYHTETYGMPERPNDQP
jgi:hypothetical protein